MISFRKHIVNGLPGMRVLAGANILGTIFNVGRGDGDGPVSMTWQGVAPDGVRFSARSKPKIVQLLQIHAASRRAA